MLCALHVSNVQNSFIYVSGILVHHSVDMLCSTPAPCGAFGQTDGAQSGFTDGSGGELFSVGYTH